MSKFNNRLILLVTVFFIITVLSACGTNDKEAVMSAASPSTIPTVSPTGMQIISQTGSQTISQTGTQTISQTDARTISQTGTRTISQTGSQSPVPSAPPLIANKQVLPDEPAATAAPINTAAPTAAEAPMTAQTPLITQESAAALLIAIDPGHQGKGNSETEPIGPGAAESKLKVSYGTSGTVTKVPEYELNLAVSLQLRDELLARGYQVLMIRETNDVNISNRERAEIASEGGADILIRIHADGNANETVHGISALCPSGDNPYIAHLYEGCRDLSEAVLAAMIGTTGARDRGVFEVDNMSGINWSTIPVTIIEMGFMTNPAEDELMQTAEYQQKLVQGMADGIEQYFADR